MQTIYYRRVSPGSGLAQKFLRVFLEIAKQNLSKKLIQVL